MTSEEFSSLASTYDIVPLSTITLADTLTPVSAYLRIREKGKNSYLFESVEGGERLARYSFIGTDPIVNISCRGKTTTVRTNGRSTTHDEDYFTVLKTVIAAHRQPHLNNLPRFTAGLVGYIGYDMIRHIEDIPENGADPVGTNDAMLALFSSLVVFDHVRHQVYLIINVLIDRSRDLTAQFQEAQENLLKLEERLRKKSAPVLTFRAGMENLIPETPREQFLSNVERAKTYITEGDIFQVVLSQRFSTTFEGDPFNAYRALRVINPSPYLYYLEFDDVKVVGSSPEILVRVQQDTCEVYPIAGTRPRGRTDEEDLAHERDLLADEKELAEHIMLVDLGRNDLGKVCIPGSVGVDRRMFIVRYSHVMHIASRVTGKLHPSQNCIDVFRATFPAGTVSGAPKIRAMEIIDDMEPTRRGIYAGAVGYVDFAGNMDMCIAIRTMIAVGQHLYFQVGAGIVADSIPENEYQETLNKGKALTEALSMAERITE